MKRNLKIGTVIAYKCDSFEIIPDDRQKKIQCINGKVVVLDGGVCSAGTDYSCECTIEKKDLNTIASYWGNRTKVNVQYQNDVFKNLRVLVKSWGSIDKHPNHYKLKLEFWGL